MGSRNTAAAHVRLHIAIVHEAKSILLRCNYPAFPPDTTDRSFKPEDPKYEQDSKASHKRQDPKGIAGGCGCSKPEPRMFHNIKHKQQTLNL